MLSRLKPVWMRSIWLNIGTVHTNYNFVIIRWRWLNKLRLQVPGLGVSLKKYRYRSIGNTFQASFTILPILLINGIHDSIAIASLPIFGLNYPSFQAICLQHILASVHIGCKRHKSVGFCAKLVTLIIYLVQQLQLNIDQTKFVCTPAGCRLHACHSW